MEFLISFSLGKETYTWSNALLGVNGFEHLKRCRAGSLGHRVAHLFVAIIEFLPIIGQIVALFEKILFTYVIYPLSVKDKTDQEPLCVGRIPSRQAINECEKSLGVKKKVYGESSHELLPDLNNLGVLYRDQGQVSTAVKLYEEALEILKSVKGSFEEEEATIKDNLGLSYRAGKNCLKAIEVFKESLKVRMRVCGEESSPVASSLNNLAMAYQDEGLFNEAIELYQQSIQIWKKLDRGNTFEMAFVLSNLATAYQDCGDFLEAVRFQNESLLIWKTLPKYEESPGFATFLNNLGVLQRMRGDIDSAIHYHKESLAIKERIYGLDHPEVKISLDNLKLANYIKSTLNTA